MEVGSPGLPPGPRGRLREVALVFLKLGTVGFGGPAAHVALMHDEVVRRRRWLSEAEFLDLVGAVNLIPGPNSTELAIHLGYRRAGWAGLWLAGACFILPAFLAVLGCAVAVGQVTPGPLFTTATFVGYLLDGLRGASVAALGIFLPAFAFVALSLPLVPRVRRSPLASHFLDGVNAASWALMAGVSVRLARGAVVDGLTAVLAAAALWLAWRRVSTTLLVVGAALVGVLSRGL